MKDLFGRPARHQALAGLRRVATRPIPRHDDDGDGDICAGRPNELGSKDAADYIETMSLQLEELAVASDLTFLSYLLRLVAEEARLVAGPGDR